MKAYVLHQAGDLRYENWPLPELKPGWALVRVLAAGICSSDIPRIFTKGTYHFPTAGRWRLYTMRHTAAGLENASGFSH